jgi:hypothetical protein
MKVTKLKWHKVKKDLSNLPDHTNWLLVQTKAKEIYIGNIFNSKEFRLRHSHSFFKKELITRFAFLTDITNKLNEPN